MLTSVLFGKQRGISLTPRSPVPSISELLPESFTRLSEEWLVAVAGCLFAASTDELCLCRFPTSRPEVPLP